MIMRLVGHALMGKTYNNTESYRVISEQNPKENMERPF